MQAKLSSSREEYNSNYQSQQYFKVPKKLSDITMLMLPICTVTLDQKSRCLKLDKATQI